MKKCSWEYILDIGFDYIIMRERVGGERERVLIKYEKRKVEIGEPLL